MKEIYIILICICLMFVGCEGCKKDFKHIKSNWVGLQRKITFYSPDGTVHIWEGRFKIEVNYSTLAFIDENGKEIKLPAQFTVVEEK